MPTKPQPDARTAREALAHELAGYVARIDQLQQLIAETLDVLRSLDVAPGPNEPVADHFARLVQTVNDVTGRALDIAAADLLHKAVRDGRISLLARLRRVHDSLPEADRKATAGYRPTAHNPAAPTDPIAKRLAQLEKKDRICDANR